MTKGGKHSASSERTWRAIHTLLPSGWHVRVEKPGVYSSPVDGTYRTPRILSDTESVDLVIDGQIVGQIAVADLLPRRP